MDAVDCARHRVLLASPGSESVAFESSGLCVFVCWGGARENEGDKVMSRSDGAFKRHLKYCNYETAAHNATVAIRSQYSCVAQPHTHACVLRYCHTNSETPAQDPLSSPRCT